MSLNRTEKTKASQVASWLSICFLFAMPLFSQEAQKHGSYLKIAENILKKGLLEEKAFHVLEKLVLLGPRLTGSPQAAAAVELMRQEMTDLGLENVHLEPVKVGRWVRGAPEEARLVSRIFGTLPLSIRAIGGSIATSDDGVSAPVIEVHSFAELQSLGEKAAGKIVFFNRAMDSTLLNTFTAYGQAADQRVHGAVEAAKAGGIAALVRSLTTRLDDFPHTGLMRYDASIPKIPAACISTKGADLLHRALQRDPDLRVHMKLNCQSLSPVVSHNVIGQITGHERPEEIVLLGGHLDSWDLSVGAHDDGAGCVQSLEALRLIQELGLKPKRTIRAVMFMDEENGGTGGRAYAKAEQRKGEIHRAAIESDRGGFLPLGFGIGGGAQVFKRLQRWEYVFQSLGLNWLRPGGGGVDISPLGDQGSVLIGLVPDSQRYFDVHHSALDTIDTVNPRELELGAVAMAVLGYILAQEGLD